MRAVGFVKALAFYRSSFSSTSASATRTQRSMMKMKMSISMAVLFITIPWQDGVYNTVMFNPTLSSSGPRSRTTTGSFTCIIVIDMTLFFTIIIDIVYSAPSLSHMLRFVAVQYVLSNLFLEFRKNTGCKAVNFKRSVINKNKNWTKTFWTFEEGLFQSNSFLPA